MLDNSPSSTNRHRQIDPRLIVFGIVVVITIAGILASCSEFSDTDNQQTMTPTRPEIRTAIEFTKTVTSTNLPTSTISPTPTVTITPTITPIPLSISVPLPFVDKFDSNSYKSEWRIIGKEPVVIDGLLTSDPEHPSQAWVFVGDDSWSNYTVDISLKAGVLVSPVAIGVRVGDFDTMLALQMDKNSTPAIYYVEGGVWNIMPKTNELWVDFHPFYNYLIKVKGDKLRTGHNSA